VLLHIQSGPTGGQAGSTRHGRRTPVVVDRQRRQLLRRPINLFILGFFRKRPCTRPWKRTVHTAVYTACTVSEHGRIHGMYGACTSVYGRVYGLCTRPYTWPVHFDRVYGCVHVNTARTRPWKRRVYIRVHGHAVYTAVYTAVYVYGTCTWSCTRPCTRPCTRVHGRIHGLYTGRVQGVYIRPCMRPYTGRVDGMTVYTTVYGPCTLNIN